MKYTIAALVLALIIIATISSSETMMVSAWGPSSHYYFTCTAMYGRNGVKDCLANKRALLSGTEMPDAFFFGNFVTGSACTKFQALHSIILAGELVLEAIKQNQAADSEIMQFALGYGCHVVADGAAFFPGGVGFIGSGWKLSNNETSKLGTDWVAVWPTMSAIDAFVTQNKLPGPVIPHLHLPQLDDNIAKFIARVAGRTEKNINASDVTQCGAAWSNVVANEVAQTSQMPAAAYQWSMVYNSPYPSVKTFSDVLTAFEMSSSCAVGAVKTWLNAIRAPNATALSAQGATYAYFEKQVEGGKCSPPQK